MQENILISANHPDEMAMAAFVSGKCSLAGRAEIEDHCLECEECRTTLAILFRVYVSELSEEERQEIEPLYSLGIEAAAMARWHVGDNDIETNSDQSQSRGEPVEINEISGIDDNSSQNPQVTGVTAFNAERSLMNQSLRLAALTILLMIVGAGAYWFYGSRTEGEVWKTALNLINRERRPMESRVTGGFAYQPYERTRGRQEKTEIDRDQFNYALAELTRAVASHPTAEARHALGRLYLLLAEFDLAENQLSLALSADPRQAAIHADLAALYYERSKFADPFPLLSKALEHYDAAIVIDPSLAEAWFNRALCHEQMALFSKAREDWRRYLELDSDSEWAAEARKHLQKIATESDRPDKTK